MADNTRIEWADATLNYVNGCTRVSPGCVNCYAERLAATRLRPVPSRAGLAEMTANGPRWTGKINIDDRALEQVLRWRRPRRIFWNAHGDLFHEAVPDEAIDRLFAVCALTPHHTHLILTKRVGRMRAYLNGVGLDGLFDGRLQRIQQAAYLIAAQRKSYWDEATGQAARQACIDALHRIDDRTNAGFGNVWLGVSVEDQQRADERIPDLLATPAAVRFISAEPLLGPINLRHRRESGDEITTTSWLHGTWQNVDGDHMRCGHLFGKAKLDWVIAGGESGSNARPMHPAWARSLRDQCAAAGVPFFFKQHGEHIAHPAPTAWFLDTGEPVPSEFEPVRFERIGKKAAGRLLDGVEHNGFPEVRP